MTQILVGLTNNKTSFWDPNTKTYLTLANKTKVVTFNEADPEIGKHLERICHGLFASNPAIRLYEGKIPTEALEYWKAKFNLTGLSIAKNRADKLNSKSAVKDQTVVGNSSTKTNKVLTTTIETKEVTPKELLNEEVKVDEVENNEIETDEVKAKSKSKRKAATEK